MQIPVYQQIKDILREEIIQGKYKAGDTLPSANQLSKMFSTSRNTAVKAINDLVHEGTIHCIQGKGSIVNDLRQEKIIENKRRSRNTTVPDIGILISDFNDLNHPYFNEIISGISKKSQTVPCNLKTFCISNYSIKDFIKTEYFDGLIVATKLPQSSVLMLKQNQIPFVLVNNDIYGEELLCVTSDTYNTCYKAVKYLHSLGHSKIAVLSGPSTARSTPLAYMAYKNALSDLGLELGEGFFRASEYGEESGYKKFKEIIDSGDIPTALFALEDNIAVGAIRAAEENSLMVPRDISIIGNGNRFPVSNVKIPLTTFDNKLEEIGAMCLEVLDKSLKNKEIKEPKINISSEFIIRKSCSMLLK